MIGLEAGPYHALLKPGRGAHISSPHPLMARTWACDLKMANHILPGTLNVEGVMQRCAVSDFSTSYCKVKNLIAQQWYQGTTGSRCSGKYQLAMEPTVSCYQTIPATKSLLYHVMPSLVPDPWFSRPLMDPMKYVTPFSVSQDGMVYVLIINKPQISSLFFVHANLQQVQWLFKTAPLQMGTQGYRLTSCGCLIQNLRPPWLPQQNREQKD